MRAAVLTLVTARLATPRTQDGLGPVPGTELLGTAGDVNVTLARIGDDSVRRLVSDWQPVLWYALGEERLHAIRYSFSKAPQLDVFDPGVRLVAEGTFGPERTISIAPDAAAMAVTRVGAKRDTAVLCISGPASLPFAWSFDGATLLAQTLFPVSVTPGRLGLMLDYLRSSAHPSSARAAESLLTHPVYFVRWKAMQALSAIDPQRTDRLLEAALQDSHPLIRSTAAGLLQQRGEASVCP